MTVRRPRSHGGNEGIQANSVRADVLAVGHGARAVKTTAAEGELVKAVADLQRAIDALQVRQTVAGELTAVVAAAAAPQPKAEEVGTAVAGLVDKLKRAGMVVGEMAAMIDPLTKIASVLRLPLAYFGI